MEIDRAVARMFVVGFDGPVVTHDMRRMIDRGAAGAILFARNIVSPEQFNVLCGELKRLAGRRPLFTCIDQEGGRVARLRNGMTALPPMRSVGRANDPQLARRVGQVLGDELRAVNVDVNFAPVLDVDTNPANPVIGDRSFGNSPDVVSAMGVALIEGMQSRGVAACAKHFPGHGDTSQDSHLDLPRLPHDMKRLDAVELAPFAAAVRAGVASMMTAHVLFEALDANYPATMSRPALDGILRDRFGFDGVVFSDCLQMKAIADHYGVAEAVVRGANAGVDLFLVCHHASVQAEAMEALAKAVRDGRVSEARVREANGRVDVMAKRYARPAVEFDASRLRTPEHLATADEVARRGGEMADSGPDPTSS